MPSPTATLSGPLPPIKHQTTKLKRLHVIITWLLAPKRKSTPIAGMEMIVYLPPSTSTSRAKPSNPTSATTWSYPTTGADCLVAGSRQLDTSDRSGTAWTPSKSPPKSGTNVPTYTTSTPTNTYTVDPSSFIEGPDYSPLPWSCYTCQYGFSSLATARWAPASR